MVVFVDLDRDAFPEHHGSALSSEKPLPPKLTVGAAQSAPTSSKDTHDAEATARTPENPNRSAFSAALSCYPYVGPSYSPHPP